ncbi:hypothetical protein ACHAQH_000261 [Verticillium albo-atrum]
MSAAVIVQLNLPDPNVDSTQNLGQKSSMRLADRYIAQCLTGRVDRSFIEDADEWTIMESFFIFSYYGNCNKSKQAWYHLREAIGFALALGLNREVSYNDPSLEVNERRRRLYWLLFITERAYCLQHRTTSILRASIALPRIYDGADEPTLSGFVKLARLFNTIDTDFVYSWSEGYLKGSNDSVSRLLDPDQFSAMSVASVIDETQRVDVAVTQCWLRTLVCQLQVRSNESHGVGAATSVRAAARSLLHCFGAARLETLGSHGIGMEQKISDIAGFLCDMLPILPPEHLIGDFDSIPNLLHSFMCNLFIVTCIMQLSLFNSLVLLAVTLPGLSSGACVPGVTTWWHDKSTVDVKKPAAPDEVRRSRKYDVSVSPANTTRFQPSFVYESIPRNGNGKMFDPAQPGREYDLADGDGVTVEIDAGISMAWTQFQYRRDVDVRVVSSDGASLGPASNVVIRPMDLGLDVSSPQPDTIVIRVPYQESGARFSVEFQDDLYIFRSNGTGYVSEGGVVVSEEPKNALLIFASPMIPTELIPSKTSGDTHVLKPGSLTREVLGSKPTLYFEAGVYWVEKDGILGKDHIKLSPSTHYVYFEPGTYIKGAFEYTTRHPDFYTIGHAVVSGENYAYMANTIEDYTAVKDDRYSLRMFWHQSVMDNQTWHCIGPTLNAPPFNTMDLHPMNHTPHEEDNEVQSHIRDYKQVGAFYFQTDGTQMYKGTVRDVFWHVNDDAIKLYHSGAQLEGLTIWKARNNAIIQMGWKPRNVSDVSVKKVRLIHNRWIQPNAYVPSAILGASPFYADPKLIDPSRNMSLHIDDLVCEGICAALMTMAPLQNFDMLVENVHFEKMHDDSTVRIGHSVVGMDAGDNMNNYTPGQGNLTLGIVIRNWTIGSQRVDSTNWGENQLGQASIHPDFEGDWSIE